MRSGDLHFSFHVAAAYDILRHDGVQGGKNDFLGKPGSLCARTGTIKPADGGGGNPGLYELCDIRSVPPREEKTEFLSFQGECMLAVRVAVSMFAVGLMVTRMGAAWSQNYPTRPIRVVTAGPGASMDLVARVTAQGLAASLGQPVVVDNRAGAGGLIAGDIVAKASPDGYTLLTYTTAIMILPFLAKKVPFDPVKDLSPITLATSSPNVLVVHPSVRANSVKELIALAKATPDALNYASAGTGSGTHLSAELFKSMTAVNIVHVPYKTTGPALNDLISGQVQMSIPSVSTAMPHVKSGKLRGLAVTSAQPSALAPGLPTVAASGVPGYESELVVGLWAPAGTPATLISRLNREIVQVLNQTDVKEKYFTGARVVGSSPEQFALAIRSERTRLGKVIKEAGIREE